MRRELLGRVRSRGLVKCGLDVLGSADAGRTRYLWLGCQDDRTGPRAAALSGGAEGVVVHLDRPGEDGRVVGTAFTPMDATTGDLRRLFPPGVVAPLQGRPLPVVPTSTQLTAVAGSLPAAAPCAPSALRVRQLAGGGPGLGSLHTPLEVSTVGPPCLLAQDALAVDVGGAGSQPAELDLTGRAVPAVVLSAGHPLSMLLEVVDRGRPGARHTLTWSLPGGPAHPVPGPGVLPDDAARARVSLTATVT